MLLTYGLSTMISCAGPSYLRGFHSVTQNINHSCHNLCERFFSFSEQPQNSRQDVSILEFFGEYMTNLSTSYNAGLNQGLIESNALVLPLKRQEKMHLKNDVC